MTPEKRMAYEMTIAANALAVKNENKKIEEAELKVKTETVKNALSKGLDTNLVAEIAGVSLDFVVGVQQKLTNS